MDGSRKSKKRKSKKRKKPNDSGVEKTPQSPNRDESKKKKNRRTAEPEGPDDPEYKPREQCKKQKVEITQEPPLEVESNKNLKKIIDGLSDRLNEMTEIVQKLKKTSELLDKEKETPEEKVVECCFESKDAFIEHRRSIFVFGFNCSLPKDEIKSSLIKHFSSCGEVAQASVPFHCQTGSPMGFAFINMVKDEEKALTLDGSYLGGLMLEVTMAIKKDEYYGYTNHLGCNRCRTVLMKRRKEFYSFPSLPLPPLPPPEK